VGVADFVVVGLVVVEGRVEGCVVAGLVVVEGRVEGCVVVEGRVDGCVVVGLVVWRVVEGCVVVRVPVVPESDLFEVTEERDDVEVPATRRLLSTPFLC